jgi:hypothetical protein
MQGQTQNMKDKSLKSDSFVFEINMESLIVHKNVSDVSINHVIENIQKFNKRF